MSKFKKLTRPILTPTEIYTVFQKTRDYVFDDNLNYKILRLQQFWHTYYWVYRPLTGVFIFPPYLFHVSTLPWETVET